MKPSASPAKSPLKSPLKSRLPRDLQSLALWTLCASVFLLAAWRFAFATSGSDLDTDAYGHHGIAREIWNRPKDFGVHWVWLPLFHYCQALFVPIGLTLTMVRVVNVVLSAAWPIVLYFMLRESQTERRAQGSHGARRDGVPFLAATLTALSPVAMQLGTTGQPEPLHALLVLLVVWMLRRRSFVTAAFLLSAACLVRYESWSVLMAVGGLVFLDLLKPGWSFSGARAQIKPIRTWKILLPVLLPAIGILIWAVLRKPIDGEWFAFVKGTRKFANEALGVKSSLDLGQAQLWKDLRYYAVGAAWTCFGYPLVVVPFGLYRTFRREGLAFFGIFFTILAFITYVWIQRGSLGLMRHFMVLVPFYATMAAHGVALLADGFEYLLKKLTGGFALAEAGAVAVITGLSCAGIAVTYDQMDNWMMDWTEKQRIVFADRHYLASYLRSLPPGARIFCDEPSLEVFSGLSYRQFDRHFIGADEPTNLRVMEAAQTYGEVYVATWSSKLGKLRELGEVVFRPPGSPAKFDEGLAVIRVSGRPNR